MVVIYVQRNMMSSKYIALHHFNVYRHEKKLKATQVYSMVRPAPLILNPSVVGTALDIWLKSP
jgi:hypothetical protein